MPHPDAIRGTEKPRWPVVVFVIGSVSAVSVALGLTVVGPMIQRQRETPPPALASPAAPPTAQASAPAPSAEVEITERVIQPPPPKPTPAPTPAFPSASEGGMEQSPPDSTAVPPVSENAPRGESRAKPTIDAVITDADEGKAAPRGSRSGRRRDREAGLQGDAGRGREEPRPQATEQPKARSPRTSPIEALPRPLPVSQEPVVTGTTGTGETRASSTSDQDIHRGSRVFKVQVGRFAEETDAQRLRDELSSSGFSAQVVRSGREGTVLYRVQVGTFRQKENADRTVEKLKAQSYEPYIADDD
jgi:cell division protein FtsN